MPNPYDPVIALREINDDSGGEMRKPKRRKAIMTRTQMDTNVN